MPKTIDILTVVDPLGFPDNSVGLSTPISQVPMSSVQTLNNNVWMIVEHQSVQAGQATWHLSIKASPGDTIRWWDTSVVQDTNEDMIIVGFQTFNNWNLVLEEPTSDTKGCGIAYIKEGFDFSSLADLRFAMNAFQNNYIQAVIRPNASVGTQVSYYLVMAKIDTSQVGNPQLKGLYRFDPTITIVAP